MHVVLFCHSLASDWNHGNAHFLRGLVAELRGGEAAWGEMTRVGFQAPSTEGTAT